MKMALEEAVIPTKKQILENMRWGIKKEKRMKLRKIVKKNKEDEDSEQEKAYDDAHKKN